MNPAPETAPAVAHPRNESPARAGLVLTALLVAAVVCNINTVVAGIAVPDIGLAFDSPETLLTLVSLGTGLGLSMSVLYFGALADRYGRKQMLVTGILLTIVASVCSSLAPDVVTLIAAQVLVGIAGGMAYPTTLSLITALWAVGGRRTAVIALWSSVSGMATVSGSILAGLVLSSFSWRGVFLLSVPIALVAALLVWWFVPSHIDESTDPVDHTGGVLSVLALTSLVLGISFALSPRDAMLGVGLLAASALLIGLFAWRQVRTRFPLFDLAVAKQRLFWAPALGGLIAFGTLAGATFVGEQFMQSVLGYPPLIAGLAVLPAAVGLLAATSFSAKAAERLGTRDTMLVGYAVLFTAFVTMLFWHDGMAYPLIGTGYLLIGVGATFVMTASRRSLTSRTPVRRVGMASATSDLQSDLGGAVMQAVFGAVLASGFAAVFATHIAQSTEASTVSGEVTEALESSFGSASHVAAQYPQYADAIMAAAKESLAAGSLAAFLIGTGVVLAGAVMVAFAVPNRSVERSAQAPT